MSQTFFDTMKKSFVDVPTEPGIATTPFLEACESLVKLFDLLGSTAFAPVITDINGNIKKIHTRYTAAPEKSATLQSLVEAEHAEKEHTATEGLLWLNRALTFTYLALEKNITNKDEELTKSFEAAYSETLKEYHNFLVKQVFNLALKACPYRKDFYEKLGSDQAKVDSQMSAWLAALKKDVGIITQFYKENPAAKW